MLYSLYIPAGTKVLSEKAGLVTLSADAHIRDAVREEDGGFTYSVGKSRYYTCAGVIEFAPQEADEFSGPVRHKDGLVWIG